MCIQKYEWGNFKENSKMQNILCCKTSGTHPLANCQHVIPNLLSSFIPYVQIDQVSFMDVCRTQGKNNIKCKKYEIEFLFLLL